MKDCQKLFICTDLDRTLLPNGNALESPMARKLFDSLAQLPEINLVYVTGRSRKRVDEAIAQFNLPEPDYVICAVGTSIYRVEAGNWKLWEQWFAHISDQWSDLKPQRLADQLSHICKLVPQEQSEQSSYKLSYFVDVYPGKNDYWISIDNQLKDWEIFANLIHSVDDLTGEVLLDIVPRRASKLHAIEFLISEIEHNPDCVLFAGDSGNDLAVLVSNIPSVLVANASDIVRQQAIEQAAQNGAGHLLYLASGNLPDLNGNYSAGIIEGLLHFFPGIGKKIYL